MNPACVERQRATGLGSARRAGFDALLRPRSPISGDAHTDHEWQPAGAGRRPVSRAPAARVARPLQAGRIRVGNLDELPVFQRERGAMSGTTVGAFVQRLELDQDAAIDDAPKIGPHGIEEAAADVFRGHRSERLAIEQIGDQVLNVLLAVCLVRDQDRGVLQAIAVEVAECRKVCLEPAAIQLLDAAQRLFDHSVEQRSVGVRGGRCRRVV